VIVIAAFLVLSCSNLGMDQELQEDEYEDTKEEEFVASIVSNCSGEQCSDCVMMFKFKTGKLCNNCGKAFQNYAMLKTHTKKVHEQYAFGLVWNG